MRLSMRFFTNWGAGLKREFNCRVTSANKSLCPKAFRAFMIRTIDASTKWRRSSFTFAGTAPFAAAAAAEPGPLPPPAPEPFAPSPPPFDIDVSFTKGIRTRLSLLVYSGLKVKVSVSEDIPRPRLPLRRIRCFGVQRETKCRRNSESGMCVLDRI